MDDTISRQAAIDALAEDMPQQYTPDGSHPADDGIFMAQEIYADCIQTLKELPSVQPEITDEQAIGHLQASGWMQSHDKQMYEIGLKERLADDSDSYDALLPSAQPEIIACGDCKHWICHDRRCRFWNHGVKPLDWCCHAERRTDE